MALVPKSTRSPLQPTPNERTLHNLTHLPYRSWCEVCLRSKAKTDQHRTVKLREPLIQIDHTFLTDTNKQNLIILTGIDVLTGLCAAAVVPNRRFSTYAVTEIRRFVYESGRTYGTLQCDQDVSITAVAQAVIRSVGGLNFRHSPQYSSSSQGSIERFHQTLFAQVCTLKIHVEIAYGIDLPLTHPIVPWIVKHSVWISNPQ